MNPGKKPTLLFLGQQNWNYQRLQPDWDQSTRRPLTTYREYIIVDAEKGLDQEPFICLTNYSASNPLALKLRLHHIMGLDPEVEGEKFNFMYGDREQAGSQLLEPRGITLYSEAPYVVGTGDYAGRFLAKPAHLRQPICRINREFNFNIGRNWMAIDGGADLNLNTLLGGDEMAGDGIRIRPALPGSSKTMTLEQYNIRALVHSYQDGFGDDWEIEEFHGIGFGYNNNELNAFKSGNNINHDLEYVIQSKLNDDLQPIIRLNPSPPNDFVDFYVLPAYVSPGNSLLSSSDFNRSVPDINYPDLFNEKIMPRITNPSSLDSSKLNSIGFSQDEKSYHGPLQHSSSAVLFDIPPLPLLSIFQFRHANLNNYLHGPSYSIGNSYASAQVGRYKVTGLVRALDQIPEDGEGFNPLYNKSMNDLWIEVNPDKSFRDHYGHDSPWINYVREHNWKPSGGKVEMRDKEVAQEHENVTLDHSFLNNLALLDGFFLSGLGIDNEAEIGRDGLVEFWSRKDVEDFAPGYRHRPYRNPRIIPYLRNGYIGLEEIKDKFSEISHRKKYNWEVTSYMDLDDPENLERKAYQAERLRKIVF